MKFIKKFFQKKSQSRLVSVLFVATIFGLFGGVAGELITRAYLFSDDMTIPYWGEINLSNSGASSFVIKGARKVVVEQNEKQKEAIQSVNGNIVGVFRKKIGTENNDIFDTKNYYQVTEAVGQGLIITSDGWIMTSTFSPNIRTKNDIINSYIVITKDKKIYNIDNVVRDTKMSFAFIHIADVNNLNTSPLATEKENLSGREIILSNWLGDIFLSSVMSENTGLPGVKNSDLCICNLMLSNEIPAVFHGAVAFDLNSSIVGLVNNQGQIEPIKNFDASIRSILEYKTFKRASLGLYYVNVSDFVINDRSHEKGALITENTNGISILKNSPAELVGLKTGDLILSIDNTEINQNNDLNEILQSYLAGDIINVKYLRDNEEIEVRIQLSNLDKNLESAS